MRAPAVLVDVDGVLCEFNNSFLALLNQTQGTNYGFPGGFSLPHEWSWFGPAGFSKATIQAAWEFTKANPEWWHALGTHHGAVEFLDGLGRLRDQDRLAPYFVTSRPTQSVADWTQLWLKQLGFPRANVVVVTGTGRKAHVALATEAVAILDDHGPNFFGLPATCRSFLLDRPWNFQDEGSYTRVNSLSEFLEVVKNPQVIRSFAA